MLKLSFSVLLFMCSTEEMVIILKYFATTIETPSDNPDEIEEGKWAVFLVDYDDVTGKSLVGDISKVMMGVINIRAETSIDVATKEYEEMKEWIKTEYAKRTSKKGFQKDSYVLENTFSEASYLYDGLSVYTKTIDEMIVEKNEEVKIKYLRELRMDEFLGINNLTLDQYLNTSIHINRTWLYPADWEYYDAGRNDTEGMGPAWFTSNTSLPVVDIELVISTTSYTDLIRNTTAIFDHIRGHEFKGLSGRIHFTNTGFREPLILVTNIADNSSKRLNIHENLEGQNIKWYGGFLEAPDDVPGCGFNEQCKGRNWNVTIIMSSIAGALFVAIIAYRFYKMQKYENDINSKDSVIPFKELTNDAPFLHLPLAETIIKHGEYSQTTGIRKLLVIHNGDKVLLKKLPKKSVLIDREVLMEWKHLRDLNHQNINKFRGVTTVPPNICILQNYCTKGSLYDVLNKDVHLDWDFKHTFINDIMTGMMVIHDSPIKVHGRLTSKNCLINHRWVIELADFGLREFRKEEGALSQKEMLQDKNIEQKRCKDLLWTAPEHLVYPVTSSKQGDVYSFGIIMSEIINQRPPYAERDEMRAHEIIHFVRKRCIPPFRPHVTLKIGLDNKLDALMKSCWSEFPAERPTFRQIKPIMKQIRGNKVEIIDNMISMMEKYSTELEKTVTEGNEILLKERAKNNEFLYKSLPRPIGDLIISGAQLIPPHSAPVQGLLMVTIHEFSSYRYTPYQYMDILNDFQKLVDKILVQHKNVYRLYSFREEMMFCSNIGGFKPESQAQDLLSVAVKIVNGRDLFPWRHVRNRKLLLRVTLHCGPGNGIVVGNKVPTYCCLGRHYEFIKMLNLNSPEEKIIMTKEFRKQIKMKREEMIKSSQELLVCTYIGKVQPIVVTEKEQKEIEAKEKLNKQRKLLSSFKPYDVPAPILYPPKEKVKDTVKYMDVGSDVQTLFDKWYKFDQDGNPENQDDKSDDPVSLGDGKKDAENKVNPEDIDISADSGFGTDRGDSKPERISQENDDKIHV